MHIGSTPISGDADSPTYILSALSPLLLYCRVHTAFSALQINSMQRRHAHIHVYDTYTSPGNVHMYTLSYRSSNDEQTSVCIVSAGKHAVYRYRMQMNHIHLYRYTYTHVQYLAIATNSPLTHYTYTWSKAR